MVFVVIVAAVVVVVVIMAAVVIATLPLGIDVVPARRGQPDDLLAGLGLDRGHELRGNGFGAVHQGLLVRLSPLDPVANARDRRARLPEQPPLPVPPKSSAELAFEQDLLPVVGADGGFSLPTPEIDHE